MGGKMPTPIISAKGRETPEIPKEVTGEIIRALSESRTIAKIKSLLKKHGSSVQAIDIANPLEFKDSLAGRKWGDIAALPDSGISFPGVVEFDLIPS